jgi:hypothetical protein
MGLIPERNVVNYVPKFANLPILIFGRQGMGCNGDADTVTVAAEPGADFVQTRAVRTRDWNTFQRTVIEIAAMNKANPHDVSSCVIDIVDNLYDYCRDDVCRRLGIAYPGEKKDFGKSWADVNKEWRGWLTSLLDQTSVRFISHQVEKEEEITNESGLIEEVICKSPKFSGNKGAQFLDGVVRAVGHMYVDKNYRHCITFRPSARIAAKDRTGILCELGEIVLPAQKELGFSHVAALYEAKAIDMGFKIHDRKV